MNNKVIGNNFEQEYARILSEKGYWVAYMTPRQYVKSQPCDLIAIKDNEPLLIDCKTCNTHLFPISRIEENQRLAYKKYKQCNNKRYILAIKYNNKIYEINMSDIDFSQKNINLKEIKLCKL